MFRGKPTGADMKLFFFLILCALGWFGYQRYTKNAFILTESREENLVKLRTFAASINSGLPKELDAETTLLGLDVTRSGFVRRLRTTVANAAGLYNGDRQSSVLPAVRKDACDDRHFRMAMEHGFSVAYSYVDAGNNPLGTFTFRISDC
jgi:hypothetical protein